MNKRQEYVNRETETDIRGVKFRDVDLRADIMDENIDVVAYDNVEVSECMSDILKINPKIMTYERIDPTDMEVEVEKACFKARYELKKQNNTSTNNFDDVNATETLNIESKELNYSKMGATDIPTSSRVINPPPGTIHQESVINSL